MLEKLIFVGESEIGYPTETGQALQSHDGKISKITSDRLHIAHPYDLLKTESWHLWQQDCFSKERDSRSDDFISDFKLKIIKLLS
jgi:hypothetical protein